MRFLIHFLFCVFGKKLNLNLQNVHTKILLYFYLYDLDKVLGYQQIINVSYCMNTVMPCASQSDQIKYYNYLYLYNCYDGQLH